MADQDSIRNERRMVSSIALCARPPQLPATEDRTEGVSLLRLAEMHYTYILESLARPGEHYIGHTSDIKRRIQEHNAGKCSHSAKLKPWKLKLYIAFETLTQAQKFERYLKSGSGHAFANRHFWE